MTDQNQANTLQKTYDPQQERENLKQNLKASCNPEVIIKELTKLIEKGDKRTEKEEKNLVEKSNEAGMIIGLENHLPLVLSVKEDFRPLAIEVADNLIKEFDCKTPSEKILVQLVTGAYVRVMVYSNQITRTLNLGHVTPGINGFLGVISKELDRAERQLVTTLESLRQAKIPPMRVSIKTQTAFIAQNQQLNSNANPHENIDPQ